MFLLRYTWLNILPPVGYHESIHQMNFAVAFVMRNSAHTMYDALCVVWVTFYAKYNK